MRRVDSHKPVFTDLMKAAAVGRQSEVEYLLTQPETLLTLFATDRSGRNALEWARQKKFDGCASLIQEAMSREVRVRAEDREAQESIFDLKRIVRTNGSIRAVVEHAINERDIVTISNCVDGADFDRQEYVRACNLLQGYMNRHSDETVITDNSQEEFDPGPRKLIMSTWRRWLVTDPVLKNLASEAVAYASMASRWRCRDAVDATSRSRGERHREMRPPRDAQISHKTTTQARPSSWPAPRTRWS